VSLNQYLLKKNFETIYFNWYVFIIIRTMKIKCVVSHFIPWWSNWNHHILQHIIRSLSSGRRIQLWFTAPTFPGTHCDCRDRNAMSSEAPGNWHADDICCDFSDSKRSSISRTELETFILVAAMKWGGKHCSWSNASGKVCMGCSGTLTCISPESISFVVFFTPFPYFIKHFFFNIYFCSFLHVLIEIYLQWQLAGMTFKLHFYDTTIWVSTNIVTVTKLILVIFITFFKANFYW
jgi:hypothetical protein